jgi:4-amino-4-deoxy-L-arabinose transferase-like glycosyltransferase
MSASPPKTPETPEPIDRSESLGAPVAPAGTPAPAPAADNGAARSRAAGAPPAQGTPSTSPGEADPLNQAAPAAAPAPLRARTPPSGGRSATRAARGTPRPDARTLLGWAALVPILVGAAVLNTHRLAQNGYANVFYSAGVKSMLVSWHNFLFNSFDPGGLITVDKPPLGLWVQVVSAKLFGFAPLSLLLPDAIIGVLCVALLYAIARRPFGQLGALAAALTLAVFPAFVASARDNNVDLPLILLMLLACGAALRAIRTGGWGSLLASAVCVGLAFNTKTLAAYLVVPGIAVAYALCAPDPVVRRLVKLVAAGVLMVAVSFAWIAYVEATPAAQRPYVGGATNNTEMGLTFDYNGLGRVEGEVGGPGEIFVRLGAVAPFGRQYHTALALGHKRVRVPKTVATPNPILPDGHYANPTPFGVPPGPLRLFEFGLGDQAGWMVPFALFGLLALALVVVFAPRGETEDDRGGADDLADERTIVRPTDAHPADLLAAPRRESSAAQPASAQPASAPVSVASTGPSWWARVRRDPRSAALIVLGGWFLVEALVLSFSKGIVHPYYTSALAPGTAAMVGAGVSAFAYLAGRAPRDWRMLLLVLLPAAVAGTVAAQIVQLHRDHYMHWFHVPLALAAGGATVLVLAALAVRRLAAPALVLVLAALSIAPVLYARTTWSVPVEGTFPAAGARVAGALGPYGISAHDVKVDRDLMRYVDTHGATHRWELLTVSSNTSASLILLGWRAGALGGYSGTDPAVNGPGLARMVARREARYVVLGGAYSSRGGNQATQAVLDACREIPNETWLHFRRYSVYSLVLYDCAGDERALAAQA